MGDRRRWFVLVAVALSALIVTIDSSVLTVAIPTIMRDFDAPLPSVQWVLAGYSLVVASLLVIGGRLGDVFGHRVTFVAGAALFAIGSLLATVSWSVPSLFVGEALIEGLGASLMLPATLAVISITFQGRERATAFAVWGAVIGFGVAIGPVLGGWLTTDLSWRWAFGINLVVAPVSALGVLLFLERDARAARRPRLDLVGAALVSSGLFLLVFGISEGHRFGWWSSLGEWRIGTLSIVPIAFALSALFLVLFVFVEQRKERDGRDPLFEFGELRHRGYRYGLLTTATLAMGQVGQMFVLAYYLQDGRGLSALDAGLWLLPMGPAIIVGSRLGAAMTHRIAITPTVRWGLVLQLVGLVVCAVFVSPAMTFATMCTAIVLFGLGIGIASSQLTNVILSDIDDEKSGVASGANNTVRQVGAALGIAIVGTILATQGEGAGLQSVSDATSIALWFTVAASLLGIAFSFLIPPIAIPARPTDATSRTMEMLEAMEAVEPIEPSRDVVLGPRAN
jgi:EmrB/QacA subfamily drug resistance transporter